MFKVSLQGSNHLTIVMSGRLKAKGMRAALDELISKSSKIENGTLLFDVVDFHLPSLDAVVIEFSRLPSMFGFLRKFKRAAVLTDKNWLKRVSEFEGNLFPGLEIRAFVRDRKAEAEAWLSGDDK